MESHVRVGRVGSACHKEGGSFENTHIPDLFLLFPQVAGLPTNLPFLRRLSAHPDFAAATSLDTTFIPAHAAELTAPQPLPAQLVALAGVARVLLKVGS